MTDLFNRASEVSPPGDLLFESVNEQEAEQLPWFDAVQMVGPEPIPKPTSPWQALRLRLGQASTALCGYILRFELARPDIAATASASEDWLFRAVQHSAIPQAFAAESASVGMTHSAWTIIVAVDEALAASIEEHFEDGMESMLSRRLQGLVRASPDPVLGYLTKLIHRAERPSLLSEAVRWMGDLRHQGSHDQRRAFLETALHSPASEIRDGAALGLSFLADPAALPALRAAVARERLAELRSDLEGVVCELEAEADKSGCSSSAP